MKKLLPLFILIFAASINAATFTVTRSDDRNTVCISGVDCSLREAINAANASPSSDVIDFAAGLTNITLISEISILGNELSINGSGANVLTISAGSGVNGEIFRVRGDLQLSGVTLTGASGCSIRQVNSFAGGVSLDGVGITGNTNGVCGGFDAGGITIRNSTFSGNMVGVGISTQSNVNISNSTFSGNTSRAVSISGVTIVRLSNVTITNNTGGGLFAVSEATVFLRNSIVAGNNGTNGLSADISCNMFSSFNTIRSNGGNLIGASPGASANTNCIITYDPTDIRDINPLFGPFAYNGGQTPTHALLPGSPAIDAGNNSFALLPTDQRGTGFQRIVDGNNDGTAIVDIGAFEVQGPTAATATIGGRVTAGGRRGVSGAVVRLTDQNGIIRTAPTDLRGNFQFEDVAVGETFVLSVFSKQYQFTPQIISVNENITDLNFTAQ